MCCCKKCYDDEVVCKGCSEEREAALKKRVAELERELLIAAGMISTMPQFADKHPEVALKFIKEAALAEEGDVR